MSESPKPKPTRSYKTASGSSLLDLHNERLKTSGRRGTKKFVDPNKLFVGNLPFDATEADIASIFARYWKIPVEAVRDRVESIKIIRDWKTGQSKGYGFLMFYNAMDATICMTDMNQLKFKIGGRPVRFDQGKKKGADEDERLNKKKKKKKVVVEDLDAEGIAIHAALESVNGPMDEGRDMMSDDDMITFIEKGGLRGVMPLTEELADYLGQSGLYEDDGYDEPDLEDFAGVFEDDEDPDDENFVYDGVFEDIYNPNEYENLTPEEEEERSTMNREQRRAADKRRKKRKLPFKGFGEPS